MAQKWSDTRRKHSPEVEERIRRKVAAKALEVGEQLEPEIDMTFAIPLDAELEKRIKRLTKGVKVSQDEDLGDDVIL